MIDLPNLKSIDMGDYAFSSYTSAIIEGSYL